MTIDYVIDHQAKPNPTFLVIYCGVGIPTLHSRLKRTIHSGALFIIIAKLTIIQFRYIKPRCLIISPTCKNADSEIRPYCPHHSHRTSPFPGCRISIGAPARNRSFWYFLFVIIEVVSCVVRRHVSVTVGGSYERQMEEAKFGVHAVSHGRDETSSICHVTTVEPIYPSGVLPRWPTPS
nr:hypothetical protein Iba_chr03bCG17710 [Ipomoea batatas]